MSEETKNENIREVIIVGTGPAGLTAALYTARANLSPLLLEGREPGGQLTTTTDVENFPGFPEGVMGPELIENMKKQAQKFGAKFQYGIVETSSLTGEIKTLTMSDGKILKAKTVIIAAGASARLLGIESEKKMIGHGVSTCATCDGAFFRDQEILVIGGGDSALEEGTFLTKFASKVTIVHRRDELRGSKIMQDKAKANPKISFLWQRELKEVLGDPESGVTGAKILNREDQTEETVSCQGIFIAIGHTPNTGAFPEIETDAGGYIQVKNGTSQCNLPGVFAAGDIRDPRYKQAISAAGMGCMAALDAERYLEGAEIKI